MVKGVAVISGTNTIKGSLHFNQLSNGITHVKGRITGLTPGLHGFHIHALGDTTNGCNSTGPHYNPMKKDHGAPSDTERHAGDLGNILADSDGVAEVSISDSQIPLSGQHSIIGRAVVVHADPDDLGRGGHELSKTTGNAGARVGCGIIGLQSSVQIRSMLIWSHKCSTVWCIVYGFLFIITTKGYKTLSTYEWYDCMNKTSRILLQLIHRRIFYPEVPHASNFAHRNK